MEEMYKRTLQEVGSLREQLGKWEPIPTDIIIIAALGWKNVFLLERSGVLISGVKLYVRTVFGVSLSERFSLERGSTYRKLLLHTFCLLPTVTIATILLFVYCVYCCS